MANSVPASPKDLLSVLNDRLRYYETVHQEMNELLAIKEFGTMPQRFSDYFPPDTHVHVINSIARSWETTADKAAKVMMPYVPPTRRKGGTEATARKRSEKVEQIALSYYDAAGVCGKPSMKQLMAMWASDLVGLGYACGMALPSDDYQTPYLVHRDPRSHYPPVGWSPNKDSKIDGDLFAYQDTVGNLCLRYPHRAAEITREYGKSHIMGVGGKTNDISQMPIWVGEYFHTDAWYFATLDGGVVVLEASERGDKNHPGVCPSWAFSRYALTRTKGRSLYSDQISLMAATSRMISQKIDYFDKLLYARTYISEPMGGEIEEGPGGTTVLKSLGGERPFVQQIAPANPVDADQTIAMVDGFMRIQNRDPDLTGDRDSAKAMQVEMDASVNSAIQDGIWPQFTEGLPKLLSACVQIDKNLWGNVKKEAQGQRHNTPFAVAYTPNIDLDGYEHAIRIKTGIGLAGYHGVLELLQRYAAGTISLQTLLEQLPDVLEPESERRRIINDQLEKTGFAILQEKAAQGAVTLKGLAALHSAIDKDDLDFFEALEKAGPELEPPAPAADPMAMMGAAPGGPPPDMAAMLQNLPPLDQMR